MALALRWILIVSLVLCRGAVSVADSKAARPVESAECKEITARVVQETDAAFERISPLGDNVFFRHPLDSSMVLSCTNHRLTGIYVSWDGPFPSNSWFHLAAAAGHAVTGKDLPSLDKAIRDCHRAALNDKSELSELDVPQAKIECQAFTRDGGGVTVSIWTNDHEARKGIEDPE